MAGIPFSDTVFRSPDAVRAGLVSRSGLRRAGYQRLYRGIWAGPDVEVTYGLRLAALDRHILPPGCVLAGRSAAFLHGVPAGAWDDIDLVADRRFGPIHGVHVHLGMPPSDEVLTSADGLAYTAIGRTCRDLALWFPLTASVPLLDALIRTGVVSLTDIERYALHHEPDRGWRKLLTAAEYCDSAARTQFESRVRVSLMTHGVPRPFCGLFDDVPLAWPEESVGVTLAGAVPESVGEPWILHEVTEDRLRYDAAGFAEEVKGSLRGRGRRVS
ncbi:hypothetical protein [Hamadaea tsunoensis]|uniref:hypothetical protein n=1 Tax=Hamadaea tsunoensis TaxID=53368 RepID=UPI000408B275|nr:hypothetical protein [Hamadaea tsunoensis]